MTWSITSNTRRGPSNRATRKPTSLALRTITNCQSRGRYTDSATIRCICVACASHLPPRLFPCSRYLPRLPYFARLYSREPQHLSDTRTRVLENKTIHSAFHKNIFHRLTRNSYVQRSELSFCLAISRI